ncbi:MAG: extracellular solute-binding protein [Clostridiaceae bacterium]|nr:extracellular solute-binding protein [Clostridiaceae bacterium]
MLKGYSKLMSAVLIALLVISMVLTGCGKTETGAPQGNTQTPQTGSQKEPDSQDGLLSWQKDTSPFEFDLYFFAAWGTHYPWRGALVEQYITEDTGVKPNIIIPTGNEQEYLNVMIASNDLPDAMVLEWYAPETKRLIEAGYIHSVNDLSAEHAPEFMDMISEDVIKYHAHTDGKLYYLPSFMPTKEEYEQSLEKHGARSLFIQKRIYEGLGKPSADTPEKLLQILRDIRDKYPDVKPFSIESPLDVIQGGLTGNLTMQYFAGIFAPETYAKDIYLDNGQIKLIFENENFIEAVRFLNQIYREGLISVDTLMMKHEVWGETVDSAQWGVTGRFPIDIWKSHNHKIMQLKNDEGYTYIPLEFQKYNGKEPQFAGGRGAGWVASMVTKNAKNPGRIIRYFEYCWSDEGQIANMFGREGVTFDFVDGVPQYKPEILKDMEENPDALENKYGFEQRLLMWRSKWGGLQKVAMAPPSYAEYLKDVGKYGVDIWELGLDNLDPDPTSDAGVAYQKIKNIWNKYLAQMVLAENDEDFNASYNAAMKELQDAGLEKVRAVMQENHIKDLQAKGVR